MVGLLNDVSDVIQGEVVAQTLDVSWSATPGGRVSCVPEILQPPKSKTLYLGF